MFEEILFILLMLTGLLFSFLVGRYWNEAPKEKKVVKFRERADTVEGLLQNLAEQLIQPSKVIHHYTERLERDPYNVDYLATLGREGQRINKMTRLLESYAHLSEVEVSEDKVSLKEASDAALREMQRKGERTPRVVVKALTRYSCDRQLLKHFFIITYRNTVSDDALTWIEVGNIEGDSRGLGRFFLRIIRPTPQLNQSNPFTLYNRRRISHGGMGRGLAFARKILALHGGKMWLQEAHENGVILWCSLPISAPLVRSSAERVRK